MIKTDNAKTVFTKRKFMFEDKSKVVKGFRVIVRRE